MTKQDNNDSYDLAKKEIMKAWSLLRQTCVSLGVLSPDSKKGAFAQKLKKGE